MPRFPCLPRTREKDYEAAEEALTACAATEETLTVCAVAEEALTACATAEEAFVGLHSS